MNNLPFKSTDAAFKYAQKHFVKNKLSPKESYIGIVRLIDDRKHPSVYMLEIVCKAGNFFNRHSSTTVAAVKHPDLTIKINENDLVIFGAENTNIKIPTGMLLYKLKPELDLDSNRFIQSEEKPQTSKVDIKNAAQEGIKIWEHDLDYKYGLLLPESEILEDESCLYFCQTNRKKLCAAWDIKKEKWQVNINRSLLDGLSFSTPKRFEQIVFGKQSNEDGYYRKQYLIEYLLFGLNAGEIKTLSKNVDNEAKIEFSIEAGTWNNMLVGNPVGVEDGMCKYFEKNSIDERILHFALLSNEWNITVEFVLGEYEEYEQHSFNIKDFDGYFLTP